MQLFILDDQKRPVPTDNLHEWGTYLEQHGSTVAFDIVDGVRVSTAFLGNLTDREARGAADDVRDHDPGRAVVR